MSLLFLSGDLPVLERFCVNGITEYGVFLCVYMCVWVLRTQCEICPLTTFLSAQSSGVNYCHDTVPRIFELHLYVPSPSPIPSVLYFDELV